MQPQPSVPDLEDNMPAAIVALPGASQQWAMGLHKAVIDMRKEIARARWMFAGMSFVLVVIVTAIELFFRMRGH